jgi:Galactose oxidase, central domain
MTLMPSMFMRPWLLSPFALAAGLLAAPLPQEPRAAADTPGPRRGHALVFDEARKVVQLFGGMKSVGPPSELASGALWAWNGKVWREAGATNGPAPRQHGCMSYDRERKTVVLYGGTGSDDDPAKAFDDTWEWDGKKWTRIAESGPGPRIHATATYDPQRRRVLLFGGFDAAKGKDRSDLLEWNGKRWSRIDTAPPPTGFAPKLVGRDATHAPLLLAVDPKQTLLLAFAWSGREFSPFGRDAPHVLDGAMAWTAKGGLLVFGGFDGKQISADTWRLTEDRWNRLAVAGPPARGASALAFDSARGRAVLYGGASSETCLADTWEFDGAKWIAVDTATAPK